MKNRDLVAHHGTICYNIIVSWCAIDTEVAHNAEIESCSIR